LSYGCGSKENTESISPGFPYNLTLSPSFEPWGGLISSIYVCSSFDAHITIPWDMFPARGLGFKFENTKTNASFFISSKDICYLTPEPIVLSSPSPRSIFSRYNLSDPSQIVHSIIFPTLKSHALNHSSSGERDVFGYAAAGAFAFFSFFSFFWFSSLLFSTYFS